MYSIVTIITNSYFFFLLKKYIKKDKLDKQI